MLAILRHTTHTLTSLFQPVVGLILLAAALGVGGYTIACVTGHANWLYLPVRFGNTIFYDAGHYIQWSGTALLFGLLFYLPSSARVMALETSHRRFNMTMDDVTNAYYASHRADRKDTFKLKSEYDSIKERMAFLSNHPDLVELETNVIEVAAQMSHVSRDLAATYSDTNVERARDFLIQRQQEVQEFNARLDEAKAVTLELRKWTEQVEMDESIAKAQLERLKEELVGVLPELVSLSEEQEAPETSDDFDVPKMATAVGDDVIAPSSDLNAIDVGPDDPQIVSLLARRKKAH